MSISIKSKTSTTNTTKSAGRTISYIVMHYTAGTTSKSGSAASTAAYFAKSSTKASADFIVDDATIIQFNPDVANRYTWHCGGSKISGSSGGSYYGKATNKSSIGVEICSTNSTGTVKDANDFTWSFTDAALAKATELVNYLMETYGIDTDHVIRHYDVTGKLCPGIVGWNLDSGSESKWKSWKAGLTGSSSSSGSSATSSSSTATTTTTASSDTTDTVTATDAAKSYLKSLAGTYTVTASSGLNVRHGAGTSKSIMCTVPKGTAVTSYGYYTTYSGVKWLYVQFTFSGVKYTGFASSAYLSKS